MEDLIYEEKLNNEDTRCCRYDGLNAHWMW